MSGRSVARSVGSSVVAAGFVETARRARAGRVGSREERAFRWFNDRSDRPTAPVWVVMQSGSLGAVFAAAGWTAWRRGMRPALAVAAVGTAVWGGAKAVKPFVGRGRPHEYLADVHVRGRPQSGLGYPSGHAAVALTLALTLPRGIGTRSRSWFVPAGIGVAGSAAAARMYVGAHLPLDVVGGLALGVAGGRIGARVLDRTIRS